MTTGEQPIPAAPTASATPFWQREDWLAVLLGATILLGGLAVVAVGVQPGQWRDASSATQVDTAGATHAKKATLPLKLDNPLKKWLQKPSVWHNDLREAFAPEGKPATLPGIVGAFLLSAIVFGTTEAIMHGRVARFLLAFPIVFLLALAAYLMERQAAIEYYSLAYALWAILLGLVISNTIGTPHLLVPAMKTELYIKTGLVLLGAEVLMHELLALGLRGIVVAWIVTPIVLISTFWFGQRILRIGSPSLNMVISADMSVCGVSAAIATAAACRAKKEELSVAIGLSMMFTVAMMVALPIVIKATGMDPMVGGAWMGGTIDATGAVAAAGAALGEEAEKVATTIKMIQNVLIGIIAFGVAVYWVTFQEASATGQRADAREIWRRFPKFVLGFIAASLIASLLCWLSPIGLALVESTVAGTTKTLRGWFFCLAFVSIGLETNFRSLASQFRGGKPLVLYLAGQSLNLILTLAMAYLMFRAVTPVSS